MKIYYRKRGERRELTDEEKDIMGNGLGIGFLIGMIVITIFLEIGRHLKWIWI